MKAAKAEKQAKKEAKKAEMEKDLQEKRALAQSGDEEAAIFVKKYDERKKSQEISSRIMKACSALKKAIGEEDFAEHLEALLAEHNDE